MTIIVLSSMATRKSLEEICRAFTQESGQAVDFRAIGGVDAANLVAGGAAVDVVILADGAMKKLAGSGAVEGPSLRVFARSEMVMAVAEASPAPVIRTSNDLRAAMLELRIGYSTGPSGDHLKRLWENMGITEIVSARAVQAPAGVPVAKLVAEGDVDLGFQQASELMGQPGIQILGPLPAGCQLTTEFTAGVACTSDNTEAAYAFIAFSTSAAARDALSRHGLGEPR